MPEPTTANRPLWLIARLAGGLAGWGLSRYCGAAIWIPGLAVTLFLVLFSKSPFRPKCFIGAIATIAGHVAWFIIGSAMTGSWFATAFDITALLCGIIWLWFRPGVFPVLFLGLFEVAALASNVYSISSAEFGSTSHRGLAAHCFLRLAGIVCLIVGFVRLRTRRSSPAPVSSTVSP